MDEVFGSENFVSLVSYKSAVGMGARFLDSVTTFILWYGRSIEATKFRPLWRQLTVGEAGATRYLLAESDDGEVRRVAPDEDLSSVPGGWKRFFKQGLTSRTASATTVFPISFEGKEYRPTSGGWRTNEEGMERLIAADRLILEGRRPTYKRFFDDFRATGLNNIWDDISGGIKSRSDPKIYVVQTSTAVVERCMLMCTDPGDLVLDPTCGAGTTAYVAEQWGRRWITVDTSRVALALARQRLMGTMFPYYLLADSAEGRLKEGQVTGTALPDSSPTNDIRQGFVYERVQHITLKSIANNPDIVEGMSRDEIDAAIKKHADFELLYDKPYEDKGKVRVTGPFTVESLSPHRSIAFAGGPEAETDVPKSEQAADDDASGVDFQQTILDNLLKAGIQNGRREERIELEMIEPYAGTNIHAIGTQKVADGETPVRVGISLGPQYGTVNGKFVKDAALEARDAGGIDDADARVDLLCVLAFAFDANVVGTTVEGAEVKADLDDDFAHVAAERKLGRVPVLLVRMNSDLVMGEELKKTGAGNLFTVFGEPDIEITEDGGHLTVELLGVDVYDPTTGEVRSRDTDRIALWMIDSDYDGDSFFVRHAYFTGGQDPYKKLKRDLKAEIDEEAWASLYRTVSRPFAKPSTGRIAVKVINDYGDEVLQVFDV
jgi:adenine-specific DNA-methyltransferase